MAGHSVFGIYVNRQGVEAAVQALRDANFRSSDISVLAPENLGDIRDIGTVKQTKAPEGATAGGTSGAVVGGVLGWLVGIGALAIPGVGPFLAAGPIMAALAGVGVGAAVGGVTGALVGFGVPEFEAKRYETRLGRAASYYPFMPTAPTGFIAPKRSSKRPARKTFRAPARAAWPKPRHQRLYPHNHRRVPHPCALAKGGIRDVCSQDLFVLTALDCYSSRVVINRSAVLFVHLVV